MVFRIVLILGATTGLLACGRKTQPPIVVPEPVHVADTSVASDSIERANAARRDSLARVERELAERAAALASARTTLRELIYFAFDEATLSADARQLLDAKQATLAAMPEFQLRISGHADERGSDEYNIALGQRRAVAAKRYLVDRGIEESRLEVVSYGEERPFCTAADESCWSRNRRAEFEITSDVARAARR